MSAAADRLLVKGVLRIMKKRFIPILISSITLFSLLNGSTGLAEEVTPEESITEESITEAAGVSETEEVRLEKKTVPMRIQTSKRVDITDSEMNLYFVNGGDIPYVAVSEYLPFVGSIYEDKDLGIQAAEYEITYPTESVAKITRKDNQSMMFIDSAEDTIEFIGMNWFVATPGNSTLLSLISMGESRVGGISNLLQDDGSSYERSGSDILKFDLSEYGIDLINQDGGCYVPLQTINDLLVSRNYVYVVYNGEKVIASAHGTELTDEMYEAPTGEMSEEFAFFNYNELRFLMDTFYGLKPEHGINNFGDYFSSTGLLFDLAGTDSNAFDDALRILTMKYFDDGHSGLLKKSYLSGKMDLNDPDELDKQLSALGVSSNIMGFSGLDRKMKRQEYYPDRPEFDAMTLDGGACLYEEVGDTAIITLDSFAAKKRDYYTEADLTNPQDTIELIAYANAQITREDSPIKNVVLDLSCNGGGEADAAVFVLGWFMDIGRIALKDTLTGAQSICSFNADINLDGDFGYDDPLPIEINRYCVISNASFSCGNLVPAAFKGSNNITLIGTTSGGGTCAVLPCTTASGAIFAMSGPMQVSTVKNGSFYNVDSGVDPDFTVKTMDTLYDRERLVEYIHTLP